MSRLDELPPDQRAALALLLSQRKSYADVAGLLGIDDRAVHDRAHAALAVLAPARARGLSAEDRERIGEHLLGQQGGVSERLRTRSLLDTSEPARAWARAVSAQLESLAPGGLPEIPSADGGAADGADALPPGPAAADPSGVATAPATGETPGAAAPAGATGRSGPALPSSRVGGAIVLVALVGAIVAAVLLLSGGSSHHRTTTTSATTTSTGPSVTARIAMRSPSPTSRSIGLLQILAEGSRRAFYVVAEHMPASNGFFYALWLYNSPSSHEPLGRAPAVGSSHRLEGGGALPANAGEFKEVLLTRETSSRPTHPGTVVLHGSFTLGGG
jgi:hypothetical protein